MSIESSRQGWIENHRDQGHQPYPNPTPENPERWDCKCDPEAGWTAVWRILTHKQIEAKYAHLKRTNKTTPVQK